MATSPDPDLRGLVVSPPNKETMATKMQQGQTPMTPTSPVSPTSESSFTTSPPGSPPFVARVSMSPNRTTALRSAASAIAVSSNRPPNNRQGAPNSFSPTSPSQIPVQGSQAGFHHHPQVLAPSLSPASSMIFERSVQTQQHMTDSSWLLLSSDEEQGLDAALSGNPVHVNVTARIPTHVLTEDYIPPVLEASTMAIAGGHDPEDVEIVTHAAHQSVGDSIGATPATGTASTTTLLPGLQQHSLLENIGEEAEERVDKGLDGNTGTTKAVTCHSVAELLAGSAYGANHLDDWDAGNLRRLSFVSFADVVHGEQSGYGPGGTSPPSSSGACSPVSARGNMKPNPSASSGSGGGSPSFVPTGTLPSGTVVGDLVYSKMSSAMRLAGRESTEC